MPGHYHAVIWIDHQEAHVFHFNYADAERLIVHSEHPTRHIHHKANCIWSGRASANHDYFRAVLQSVADAGAVLITGPANAKAELIKHIHQHDPEKMKIIAGIEAVDHPNDGELVAYARKYFKIEDRMRPQRA